MTSSYCSTTTTTEARDSDLDVAVTRRSFGAVDALMRTDMFRRMLQRFHYDVHGATRM